MAGPIEEAVRYSDAGQIVLDSGARCVPFGFEGWLGAYLHQPSGSPNGWSSGAAPSSHAIATHALTASGLVFALMRSGAGEEAMAVANGLIDAAETTRNPCARRSRCSPTGSPSATPIPSARLTPCGGAW